RLTDVQTLQAVVAYVRARMQPGEPHPEGPGPNGARPTAPRAEVASSELGGAFEPRPVSLQPATVSPSPNASLSGWRVAVRGGEPAQRATFRRILGERGAVCVETNDAVDGVVVLAPEL